MPRTTIRGLCAVLVLLAGCERADQGERISPGAGSGVRTGEIPLAELVPAVPAMDPEQGTCDISHRQPSGFGFVQMSWPGGPGEMHTATVMLSPSGEVMTYGEARQTAAGMTSIQINVPEGTGGATSVTEGGARMTIGRGTADEALRSAALGNPARTIERMLARCGRPGATS